MMPYMESPEDRALSKPFRFYKGQKIDIRWSGGWLTPEGTFHPVNYANGITHETIANEHGDLIQGSGSIMSMPPIMRIFDIAKWMRITYFEYSTFAVQLKGTLTDKIYRMTGQGFDCNRRRQNVLLRFVRDYGNFENYFINDTRHSCYREFLAAIKNNEVYPTKG